MTTLGHAGRTSASFSSLLLALSLASCLPARDELPRPDEPVVPAHVAPELAAVTPPLPDLLRPAAAAAPTAHPSRPRFLVLGDSIVFGAFGTSLEANLQARGGEVWLHGSCGASSVSYLRGIRSECGALHHEPETPAERISGPAPTPKLDALLASVHPDAAILVLGTNFMCCSAQAAPDVRELVSRLAEAHVPCLWVGVPSFREPPSAPLVRHYAMLEESLATKCTLLDARSLGIAFRHVGDKVHVEPESGREWAEAVAGAAFQLPLAPSVTPPPVNDVNDRLGAN